MKKDIHTIGPHGTAIFVTKQGDFCVQCDKRVNRRGTNPRDKTGKFTSAPAKSTKTPVSCHRKYELPGYSEVMESLKKLEDEVVHIKRNVFYDCSKCNPKRTGRWHEHI